jgi:hypothetical protein
MGSGVARGVEVCHGVTACHGVHVSAPLATFDYFSHKSLNTRWVNGHYGSLGSMGPGVSWVQFRARDFPRNRPRLLLPLPLALPHRSFLPFWDSASNSRARRWYLTTVPLPRRVRRAISRQLKPAYLKPMISTRSTFFRGRAIQSILRAVWGRWPV